MRESSKKNSSRKSFQFNYDIYSSSIFIIINFFISFIRCICLFISYHLLYAFPLQKHAQFFLQKHYIIDNKRSYFKTHLYLFSEFYAFQPRVS